MTLAIPSAERANYANYVEWDVPNWSIALDFWAEHTRVDLSGCEALEVGSRHGGLSLWLARQGANVTCTDLDGPSPRARRTHAAAGVSGRVRYEAMNALRIPYESQFDVVIFKSVLGALGEGTGWSPQAEALRQMHQALKPGGELLFAENLVASPAHRFLRRRFVDWGARWRYMSLHEMRDFLQPFDSVVWRTAGFAGALGRSRRQRALLGAIDRAGLDRIVPEHWRYLVCGIARR